MAMNTARRRCTLLNVCFFFFLIASALDNSALAQTSFPDAAVPVTIVPTKGSQQFFAINQDKSLYASATTQTSTYAATCAVPAGISGTQTASTVVGFDEGSRYLFETGIGSTGTNAIVGLGAAFSGTTCSSTPALAFYGTSVSLSAVDRRNQKVLVLSNNGVGTQDVVTSFSTNGAGNYYSPGSLSKRGQANLDTGGTYSAMVTDVDGTVGYSAITQVRTSTSAGALWIYDPTFNRTVKVLGPGGVALSAVNAFIIHNPMSIGGGLLVLTNQDLLTNDNLDSPPAVTTPFTLIDMGQLGALLQNHPTATSVTLPFITTIQSSLSYYAIFGSAFNVLDNKLYLLVGTGSSATNPQRQVIRYDPANPAVPAETVVADVSSVPLYPGSLPQITLNAAAGTLQVLTTSPNTVYGANIQGTGGTTFPLSGSTFGDTGFNPTFIATNPLLGETYIASASGKVDVVTLPAPLQPRATINLNGPLSSPTAGQSTSVQVESTFPIYDSALSSTTITITATAASTGQSFTFASPSAGSTLSQTRYVSGTFPSNDIYTLVASFPGDASYAAFTSPSVVVAVGTPLYPTTTSVTASASTATAGTATVTLSGSTYTPSGTITLKDAASAQTLATYTVVASSFANPISIAFTIPSGTTSITATYSGDSTNGGSTSASAAIVSTAPKSNTRLTLNAPTTGTAGVAFSTTIFMNSDNGNVPTGQVILNATPAGSSPSQIGSATTTQAFNGGATISVNLVAGTYTLQASYAGDANFNSSASNSTTVIVAAGAAAKVSLSASSLTFTSAVGTTSAYQNVTLTNTGGTALKISGINVTGVGFAQVNGCPSSLAAGTNCVIRINFTPVSANTINGALTIADDASGSPQTVTLTGTVPGPVGTVGPTSIDFGNGTLSTASVTPSGLTLTNTGVGTLTVTSFQLSNTADFEVTSSTCTSGKALSAGQSCIVYVEFHPSGAGNRTATLQFVTNDKTSTQIANISGTGLAVGACADQDGDGLCDDWEKYGLKVRLKGIDYLIDLPAFGASPTHKDVFIHADWMAQDPKLPGAHTHQPLPDAMAIVVKSFADSPLANPDGTTGARLHIDCGPTCVMNPVTGELWGKKSLAQSLPEAAAIDATGTDISKFSWNGFDNLSTFFNASGRAFAFHHVIFAHDLQPGNDTSGISRNPASPNFFQGAGDLILAMGECPGTPRGTVPAQAGTLMHELGHNLGLAHGGKDGVNSKPNYLSVMNYRFQFIGLLVNQSGNTTSPGLFDYSRFALPPIDEANLNESTGLVADATTYPGLNASFPSIDHYGTIWFCPGITGPGSAKSVNRLNATTNWDCDAGNVISTKVRVDLNGDGGINRDYNLDLKGDPLNSYNDWPALVFSGGAVGGNGAAIAAVATTSVDEFQISQQNLFIPPYRIGLAGLGLVQTAPGSTVNLRFSVANTGTTADTYGLSASSLLGWVNTTITPASITLVPGASAEVIVTYTVPAGTAEGTNDHITLRVASQTAALIFDSAETIVYASATPATLALSTGSILFSTQALNGSTPTTPLILTNTGAATLALTSFVTTAQFSQTNNCGATLASGASCVVNLSFVPTAVGVQNGTLTIIDSSTQSPEVITLSGTAVAAQLARPQALLVAPATGSTAQSVALSANITSVPAGTIPTGTVTFFNDTTQLGQVTLDAKGTAALPAATLAAGSYDLYATYSGDAKFLAVSTADQALIIQTAATVMLGSSAATALPGAPVTFTATLSGGSGAPQPSGPVKFMDGTALLGTSTLNASGVATFTTSTLALGTHNITVVYAGDATFAGSTSAPLVETISLGATTTSLTSSVPTAPVGTSILFTATVTSPAGTPTGTVTFTEGSVTLGTATLSGNGTATFTTTTLSVGTHQIAAQFAATSTYSASASAAKQVVITGVPDYSVSATPSSLSLTRGSKATAALTVTPVNGYSGTIQFSCSGAPSGAICSFAPAQVVFTASAQSTQTTTFTFDTQQHATLSLPQLRKGSNPMQLTAFAMVLWLPASLFSFACRRKLQRGRRKALLPFLALLLLMFCGIGLVSGCASGSPATSLTPAGTYSITVTITDGTNNHSLMYPVTVTP